MVPFYYRRISHGLIDELFHDKLMSRAESLILLGSRYVGKRHVLHRLRTKLEEVRIAPIVQIKFLAEPPICSEDRVREIVNAAVAQAFLPNGQLSLDANEDFGDVLGSLDRLRTAAEVDSSFRGKPIFLIASNVDSLAHHIASSFLESVRRRIDDGQIIALLSGEDDMHYLVQSLGGFNSALKYVLQAYERDEFADYLVKYASKMNITFETPADAASEIWRLTGGNSYSMRMMLWGLIESRARFDSAVDRPVTQDQIPAALDLIGIPSVYGTHVFRHGTQLIERDTDSWQALQLLIGGHPFKIGVEQSAPTRLEMAGMAIREFDGDAYLRFASPLHEDFIRKYYDDRRFGDLYSLAGKWPEALSHYSRLNENETIRPLGVSDRSDVESVVASLCSSLYSESIKYKTAGERVEFVKELFASGAKYLLGFSEVSFWIHDSWRADAGWECISPNRFAPDKAEQRLISRSLPATLAPGQQWQFEPPWQQLGLVKILPALREDQKIAVVISELKRKIPISVERGRVATTFLKHFAEAYAHVNAVDGLHIRLQVRNQHVATMNSIFNALGSDVRDVGQVLHMAAKGLRELEYKRALFSLVDPEEQRIQGYLDDNDSEPKVDLTELIDFPLKDYKADLHTLVIHEARAYPVTDATKDGRVNPELIAKGKLHSFALVPILKTDNKAIGTLLVERNDGTVPSDTEVRDLMLFGRQLAIAIEQSERVNMLQSSLDKIPEPIVIVDRAERRRYANRPAASLLNIPEGWVRPASIEKLGDEVVGIGAELLHSSLTSGNRLVSHFEGIGNDHEYRGAALTDIISDWRGMTNGGLLHVQDFNYLDRVFRAARKIGEAQDKASALTRMLEVARDILGPNNWGRLYLSDDEDNPTSLKSTLSFGYDDPNTEARFREGAVVLEKSTPDGIDWLTFDQRKPLVFCWKEGFDTTIPYVTRFGLQAINVPHPPQPPEITKKPGDFWIDFPLMTQNKVLGKLCFQCSEDLRPEDFALLTLLSEFVVGLFDAFVLRASLLSDREELIMSSTARKTVETIVHNLCTRFGNLGPLATRYWLLAEQYPNLAQLRQLNEHFVHVVDETLIAASRAKELLGPINPQWSRFDLTHHLRRALDSALPRESWTVEGPDGVEVIADANLLEMAILEMVQNSKDAALPDRALQVILTIEPLAEKLLDGEACVKITYRDTGRGIPAEYSEKIFEELFSFRPGKTTSGFSGSGLGLVFVRRVFEAHGGFIITGLPTQGAEFVSAIRRLNARSETKEETDVSHTYS